MPAVCPAATRKQVLTSRHLTATDSNTTDGAGHCNPAEFSAKMTG